jgi:hypothetical protein
MNMNSDAMQEDEDYEVTAVEVDGDNNDESAYKEETRTNVRESSDDDELSSYSDGVKKRINQLTAKRKQAMEEAQAAYQYANQVKNENESMKSRLAQLDKGYISEFETRISSQEQQARRVLADAHENGDYERMANAQEAIAQIAIEKERLRSQKARSAQQAEQEQYTQQQRQVASQQQRQQPAEDPQLRRWLSKNSWFGEDGDAIMTSAAQAIHKQLVMSEGFDPTSEEYYSEIDRRIRREMPNKFQSVKRSAQAVTPASNGRSLKSGRKESVELTPGQVAFAKKMRIPLDVYAKEVVKLNKRSN